MSSKIVMRRGAAVEVLDGADEVLYGFPMPSQSKLTQLDMWFLVTLRDSASLPIYKVMQYDLVAYIVPVPDPDTPVALDTLWDTFVPKQADLGAGGYDIDTAGTDTGAVYDLGEVDVNKLVGETGNVPEQIFRHRGILSAADGQTFIRSGDPEIWVWAGVHRKRFRLRKNRASSKPSMLLVGFSVPNEEDTGTQYSTPTESEWVMMKYITRTLEKAVDRLLGLVEPGAETPYDEAMVWLEQLIAPSYYVDSALTTPFQASRLNCVSLGTAQVMVPGDYDRRTVNAE